MDRVPLEHAWPDPRLCGRSEEDEVNSPTRWFVRPPTLMAASLAAACVFGLSHAADGQPSAAESSAGPGRGKVRRPVGAATGKPLSWSFQPIGAPVPPVPKRVSFSPPRVSALFL